MKQSKRKAFTLIELIAVLVIMAIIALIVTPLVMNIIRKARISADKRSVDAYGRSIELAIAGYLLDTGKFPTEVSQLTIEYSGSQVLCETTQINTDSSVYLSDCTVAGRNVEGYTYGSDKSPSYTAYSVGDEVTYNNVNYYVIKDSGAKESTVTLLKAEPLTVAEVNQYGGVGTENNHVNNYSQKTAADYNGYGGMAYYQSETCKCTDSCVYTGCTTDYEQSEVKYVVDAWKISKAPAATEARLIQYDEIIDNFEYELGMLNPSNEGWKPSSSTPSWVHNNNYPYWTLSSYNDLADRVFQVYYDGSLNEQHVISGSVVRPVITLSKSSL